MMMLLIIQVLLHLGLSKAGAPAPIIFIIESQAGNLHSSIAETSEKSILSQWTKYVPEHVMNPPKILLTHNFKKSVSFSTWTMFPLIEVLASHMVAEESLEWAAILSENTKVDLKNLNIAVEKYQFNPTGERIFLGRGLKDSDTTIVHHFDHPSLLYPDLESGIFLSRKLILDLKEELDQESNDLFPKDFNIDPAYEFAEYINRNGEGTKLKHLDEICAKKSTKHKCITFAQTQTSCLKSSQTAEMNAVLGRSLVAVKTCQKFHKSRVEEVLKKTWGPLLPHIDYISDHEELDIPTKVLPKTVNTETGHCNKTMAILQYFLDQEDKDLLVIADDDTILSVARLASLLSCYTDEEGPLLLGQRYGYMVANGHGRGYNYITGGGGMIFNRESATILSSCPCPSEDTPDDMHLGMCAKRLGINVIHSGRMFQARPTDYPSSLVSYRKPVSFHKHWEIDAVNVYKDYFEKADSKLKDTIKDEL